MEVEEIYGDQVRFVGVPGLADVEDIREFVTERGVDTFEHIPDVDGEIWARFDVTQHRIYVLINDDGVTETVGYGSLAEDVQALIAR